MATQGKTLEALMTHLILKDTTPLPRTFLAGKDINAHLRVVERYCASLHLDTDERKTAILVNSLDDEIQLKLFAQPEYELHENDYEWLKKKLLKMQQPKSSIVSPLISLLGIKQMPGKPLKDYVNDLRVEAYKLDHEIDSANKETFLVTAFLNGLLDRKSALAIEALKPAKLDDAFELAKKEVKCHSGLLLHEGGATAHVRAFQDGKAEDHVNLKQLQSQVHALQKQVDHLTSLLSNQHGSPMNTQNRRPYAAVARGDSRRPYQQGFLPRTSQRENFGSTPPGNHQQLSSTNNKQIQCYNCQGFGHIARNCKQARRCSNCGGFNHISRDCRKKQHLREIHTNEDWEAAGDVETNTPSEAPSRQEADENPQEADQCFMLSVEQRPAKRSQTAMRESVSKPRAKVSRVQCVRNLEESDLISKWVAYVEGRGQKPNRKIAQAKSAPKTKISECHSELASNKPLINGTCAGQRAKIFLDTGAEMNVIDSAYLKSLMTHCDGVALKQNASNGNVTCANGTKMRAVGIVNLRLGIGNCLSEQKFTVLESIFPKIIVGLRSMKSMDICVDPANDCAVIAGKVRVPFVSKTVPQSVMSGKEECPAL
jgi:hypothetical protein